jgi:hypothetical protein
VEELETQHYRGRWYGFGVVRDCEQVRLAVFERTQRNGSRLTAKSFDGKHLAGKNESVARALYITRRVFDQRVATTDVERKGALVGVACADVSRIRSIPAEFKMNLGTVRLRAFCVLDRVEQGDFDGHATVGYTDAPAGVAQGQLGTVRMAARLELANAFSEVRAPDSLPWPRNWTLFRRRLASIASNLVCAVRRRHEN